MKIMCSTKDEMAAGMMQNLCTMMSGGMMSCCMMMNGMPMMTMQHDHGHVQVRNDQRRLVHDLEQQGSGLL